MKPTDGIAAQNEEERATEKEITTELPDVERPSRSNENHPFGLPGPPINRSNPVVIGFLGALGVAAGYILVRTIVEIESTLILVFVSLFLAVGLEPVVAFLTRRRVPRFLAVIAVVLAALAVVAGFVSLAVSPITHEAEQVSQQVPIWRTQIQQGQGTVGEIAARLHLTRYFSEQKQDGLTSTVTSGALGAGKAVLSTLSSIFIVLVLTVYFLASLKSIKRFFVRLAPASRRPRVGLLLDEILSRVGGFVLGNIFTSLIAGVATVIWLEIFDVPYAVLLGLAVALLDLIPIIGSSIGAVIVTLVTLSVSIPVAIATVGFYIAFRLLEDYLLVPRVMSKAVDVSPIVTVLATLIGGEILGIVGALVAIPLAAAIQLLLQESAFPRLDRS